MKKITLTDSNGLSYELGTGLGFWAKSIEKRTLDIGDTRVIGGILMCIYLANYGVLKATYNWVPVDEKFNTFENQKKWKSSL